MSEPNRVAGGHKVRYCLPFALGNISERQLHQAALHNPNVSAEAREHSRRVIEEIQGHGSVREDDTAEPSSRLDHSSKESSRVLGGYRATLKSLFLFPKKMKNVADPTWLQHRIDPNVGDEAKQRARQILEDNDAL
jgi:hypothetical protein